MLPDYIADLVADYLYNRPVIAYRHGPVRARRVGLGWLYMPRDTFYF